MTWVLFAETVAPVVLRRFGKLGIEPLHYPLCDPNSVADHTRLARRHRSAVPVTKPPCRKYRGGDQQNTLASFVHDRTVAYSLFVRYTLPVATEGRPAVKPSLEDALIAVWRQALVENAASVELGDVRYRVRRTPKRGLREVDFVFDGREIRGLEQNPRTKSRWAQLARSSKKVMQFLSGGRYVANVVDGKVTFYGRD